MIVVKLMGGLGNQLQQYALYEKLISLGKEAAIDTTWYEDPAVQSAMLAPRRLELDYFDGLSFRRAAGEEIAAVRGKDSPVGKLFRKMRLGAGCRIYESGMYHPEIFSVEHAYLEGYWAAEKYYADILPALREKIRFPQPSEANRRMAEEIKNAPYAVCVHIRRGDYLDPANREIFGGICTEAYYESAVELVKQSHPEALFYMFSDDQEYIREHYRGSEFIPVDINHGSDSFFDIWLMSRCDAHICANSTFSFWGARLNDKAQKLMIRPSIHKNSQTFDEKEMHDLWPGWLLMDPSGKTV